MNPIFPDPTNHGLSCERAQDPVLRYISCAFSNKKSKFDSGNQPLFTSAKVMRGSGPAQRPLIAIPNP